MLYRSLLCFLLGVSFSLAQDAPRVPNINDLLTIKSAGGPRISPDGKWVAYSVTEADFKQDAFVSQIWLANTRLAFGSRPALFIRLANYPNNQ